MVWSFYILALAAVVSAFMVVKSRNPMHSALWLLVTFCAIAGIYLLLNAEFVAAIQIIIYAGGVLVLYIFVIMLVDLSSEAARQTVIHKPRQVFFAVLFAIALVLIVIWVAKSGIIGREIIIEEVSLGTDVVAEAGPDSTRTFAKELFLTYLYPFEIASVLLLVAMIGSVILARRTRTAEDSAGENETR
jgi:NADH-quinone oxidoreductase subunit J